jgi:hypothetical protein
MSTRGPDGGAGAHAPPGVRRDGRAQRRRGRRDRSRRAWARASSRERDVLVSRSAEVRIPTPRRSPTTSRRLVFAGPDWSLEQAAVAMVRGGFRHLVVIEQGGDGGDPRPCATSCAAGPTPAPSCELPRTVCPGIRTRLHTGRRRSALRRGALRARRAAAAPWPREQRALEGGAASIHAGLRGKPGHGRVGARRRRARDLGRRSAAQRSAAAVAACGVGVDPARLVAQRLAAAVPAGGGVRR